MSLWEQIQQGESKTLELKRELPRHAQIAKTAIAFANTSGGKLVIGVDDERQLVGIAEEQVFSLQDQITSIIADRCYPPILPEIYTANVDGKLLLVVEIFRGNLLPHYLKSEGKENGTYLRIGASNRKAALLHIIELERQRASQSFDEETYPENCLHELDLSPLQSRFAALGKPLDNDKLKNLKLVRQEQGQLFPTDDIVNVVSPGGFPNTLTAEGLTEGRSEIRNRAIARVLKELGYIEQWGSGLQRIRNSCLAQGLKVPRIREQGDFVDVEFYRPVVESGGKVAETIPSRTITNDYERLRVITDAWQSLPPNEDQVLLYLLDHGQISRKATMELLGLGQTAAYGVLSDLVEKGFIERLGQGRSTAYRLLRGKG